MPTTEEFSLHSEQMQKLLEDLKEKISASAVSSLKRSFESSSRLRTVLDQRQELLSQSLVSSLKLSSDFLSRLDLKRTILAEMDLRSAVALQPLTRLAADRERSLIRSLSDARPFMSEEQQEEFDELVSPLSEEPSDETSAPRPKLTFSDWLSLISLLFTVLAFVLQQLPDAQLERIIEQNGEIIEQQSEELRICRQLLETAQSIDELLEDVAEGDEQLPEPENDVTEADDCALQIADDTDDRSDLEDDAQKDSALDEAERAEQ